MPSFSNHLFEGEIAGTLTLIAFIILYVCLFIAGVFLTVPWSVIVVFPS